MRLPEWIARPLAPLAASLFIRGVRATMRLRCEGRAGLDSVRAQGRAYVHAFWHGHLFLMPYAYAGGRIAIMISEHRDGEIIARTMERFGHRTVRGSTTSGGAVALRAAVRLAREGWDLGFTPDGPRGPRHVAQMGVIAAARLGGIPIVPVSFAASREKRLRSWDRFVVPILFSRGVFVYGDPIEVVASADATGMEAARVKLEEALRAGEERAALLASDAAAFSRLPGLAGR